MEGENKRAHKVIVALNYTDEEFKKSHCNMSSYCGVDVAGFILFHRQEERNPREETLVKPRQSSKNMVLLLKSATCAAVRMSLAGTV